jgi:hypothetical protein
MNPTGKQVAENRRRRFEVNPAPCPRPLCGSMFERVAVLDEKT